MGFFLSLIIGIGLQILGYLLMPKPKQDRTKTSESNEPTAEAGKPIPVLFGTKMIKSPNTMWWGDKHFVKKKIKA